MATPTSIFTSPSTTIVQVDSNTIQSPYTPVLLNAVSYPGQVVTVLNTLSSLAILNEPIVVSTVSTAFFSDGTFSTLLQQPQSFITAQTLLPNQWTFLNSYPFRDQALSAGVQNLTTSSLYTALTSTITNITSSLKVENLVVTGNFYQSSGLTLNTSVSSLGSVYLLSSLTVNGPTYFSSSVSSIGYTVFGSTFSVDGSFSSRSSIQIASSLTVSTSVSVVGDIVLRDDRRDVRLENGLIGTSLEVQASTPLAMDVAGYFLIQQTLSTLSSLQVGGDGFFHQMSVAGSLSSLSSFAVYESITINNEFLVQKNLSVGGTTGIAHTLEIQEALTFQSSLTTYESLFVRDALYSLSTLSTNSLYAESAYIQGNLAVSSAVVSTQNLSLNGSLGFQNMISLSTSVGGTASTLSNLVLSNGTYIEGYFYTVGTISSLSSFSVLQDVYVLESLSVGTGLAVSGGMTVVGNGTSFDFLRLQTAQPNPFISTVFENDLSIVNSISITDTAILSSIVLPSSVLAFNFITSTFTTGYQGVTQAVQISTLQTSSLTTGGLATAEQTMDMANAFQTRNLSTFQLSTLLFQVGLLAQPSTFIQFTSSFGIGTIASTNTFDVNTFAYTLSNTYVNKTLSSLQLFGSNVQGYFYGNGFLLSNVNYPAAISTLFVSTGILAVEKTNLSTLVVSSGVIVDSFFPYSTLRVGDFTVYGNAAQDILQGSNTLRTVQNSPNVLMLNNLYCYGDAAGLYQKQVVVNSNVLPSLSNLYTFGVGGVLRLSEILSPEFSLFLQTFYGDTVVGVNVGTSYTNSLSVLSGSLGKDNGVFFLPESITPLHPLSTNIVQPVLSTFVFNSTLIVNRETQKVGINTQPFYTLDSSPETFVQQGVLASYSTVVEGKINVQQQQSTFWMAVTSNDGASNILYSSDEGNTWNYFTATNPTQGGTLLNVATNGGQLRITRSNTLVSDNLWVATSVPLAQVYREGSSAWETVTNTSKFPQSNAGIAYNGQVWVLTGYNESNLPPATFPPLQWSSDGITWYQAESGGFTWDSVSREYGGHAVAWNGSLWIAVGQGASATNSVLYSGDGKNWSDAVSGGFTNGGYGVVWSGSNWVATGDNGGPVSSFCVSSDGSNWTGISGYGFNKATGYQRGSAIATDGRIVVAVGTYYSVWPSASIQYSRDGGYTWLNASGTLFNSDSDEGRSIVWNGSYWLAGGISGVRKSYDGMTWFIPPGSPSPLTFQGLAYSSNAQPVLQIGASNYVSSYTSTVTIMNVACGVELLTVDSNCLRYSGDGSNWSNAESGYFTGEGRGAAHNGSNLWVAAGKGTASNVIYSGNGKNWSNGYIFAAVSLTSGGTGVAYGSGYWLATFDNGGSGDTLFYSSNGSNWYPANSNLQFTTAGLGVAHGNGKYMAVGEGTYTILYAQTLSPPDTWTDTNIVNAFDTRGRGIVYGNSLWVACGEDTGGYTIKYSGNQSNWSNATGVFPTAGYGLGYNGSNLWVAAGDGAGMSPTSNLLYSGDAITWSNANSGDFNIKAYGVNYNQALGLWMAGGDGPSGTTLKYSGDGSNWSDATGDFDTYGYGFGVTSNVFSTQTRYINQLRIYNTPGAGVTLRDTTPNISYTSSSLTFMNTLLMDNSKSVYIREASMGYVSSLYDSSLAIVSTFVSSQASQVAGYFLTSALV